MNEYSFAVKLCDGNYCNGNIIIKADNQNAAYDEALNYVCEKLYEALPELDIEVSVEEVI